MPRMIRALTALCVLALPLLAGEAPASPLHEGFRLEVLAGDARQAAARYAEALDDPATAAAAGLGLARCLERLGQGPLAASAFGWVLSLPGLPREEAERALAGAARNAPGWLDSVETSAGRWILARSEVQEAVAGAFQILSRLKIEPYLERDGRVGGLMLREVDPASLVARRGFRPYDILRSVNARPLTSSGAAEIIALVGALKDESLVAVQVERLGRPLPLRFEILGERDLVLRHGPFPRPSLPPKESP